MVSGDVEINFDPSVVIKHPTLAALALEVIGTASQGEANFARLVSALTHGKSKPVLDYYLSLKNDAPKAAVVEALAASTLEPARLELFRAVAKYHQSTILPRQPIAHGIWADTDKLPDALLLINPRDLMANLGRMDPAVQKSIAAYKANDAKALAEAILEINVLNKDITPKVQVYREKDFKDIIRDLRRGNALVSELHDVNRWDSVSTAEAEKLAQTLSQQPELVSLIEARRRAEKDKPQETQ